MASLVADVCIDPIPRKAESVPCADSRDIVAQACFRGTSAARRRTNCGRGSVMEAFDAFVPHFRRAKERWPDAPTLAQGYDAVRESYDGSSHDIIGSSKSFIECVCRTILGE